MDFSKTFEEVGKFFNEILGYLLPGFIFNLMIYLTIDPEYFPLLKNEYLLNVWVVILLSYIMGYFVYGITLGRDIILKKIYSNKVFTTLLEIYFKALHLVGLGKGYHLPRTVLENTVNFASNSKEFIITKSFLNQQIANNVEEWNFNSVRSLVMSYIPEADQKIYTFMFRSELGNHIGFVFFSFGLWLLLSEISLVYFNNTILMKADLLGHLYVPLLLILISYFFHITRKRFIIIAYKIPFSIFISKYKPIK